MVEHRFMQAVLVRLAGNERASAILGDLLEDVGSRGRMQLWTAFARTAFSLGRRRCVPVLAALAVGELLAQIIAGLSHPQFVLATPQNIGIKMMATALALSAYASWFLLPYSVLRFGVRSRFALVCLGASVISSSAYPFSQSVPVLEVLTGLLTASTVVLLCLRTWRNSVIVFASVCVRWSLLSAVLFVALIAIFPHSLMARGPRQALEMRIFMLGSAMLMLLLCSRSIAPGKVVAGE